MKPHKWAKEIKAWADGAEIESKYDGDSELIKEWKCWKDNSEPYWNNKDWIFRIKPQPKEPQYLYVYRHDGKPEIFTQELDIINPNRLQYIGKIKLEQEEKKE